MKRLLLILAFIGLVCASADAPAQLFSKKPKVDPTRRVPELILIVKTDTDERKRSAAAEELREYDSVTFSEIVPVLVDVLKNDKKTSVRVEAVDSLAKIRPVTPMAGQAIEKAAADDEAFRVRWHAKTALTKYQLAGYSLTKAEPKKTEPKKVDTKKIEVTKGSAKKGSTVEPPLAEPDLPQPRFETVPRVPEDATPPKPLPKGVKSNPTPMQGPSLFP